MITSDERETLLAIATAENANFVELARIAGLDPATSFREADLRGVDFSGCDLRGFDFSGANLDGASFTGASLAGARFDRTPGVSSGRSSLERDEIEDVRARPLDALQNHVLEAMIGDLGRRGRALALLPLGLGRSAVLGELIARLLGPQDRAAVIVTSAAEREQLKEVLRARLPSISILSSREVVGIADWRGVIIHVSSAYDGDLSLLGSATHLNLNLLIATSLDRLQRVLRSSGDVFDHVRTAAFDMSFLVNIGPEEGRLGRLATDIFGVPTVTVTIEESLKSGFLMPAHLVQPFEPHRFPRPTTRFPTSQYLRPEDNIVELLEPIATEIVAVSQTLRLQELFVLCRDVTQARTMHHLLQSCWPAGPKVRRAPQRLSGHRIAEDLAANGGIVVAATTQQSIDAARRLSSVAVATPLRTAAAQEIAFRVPHHFRHGSYPVVLDFAGAFRGFPNLERKLSANLHRRRPR